MKNFRKIAFIFLAMCFALFAFVASCHKSDVDKKDTTKSDTTKSNTTKSKQELFFEFATVRVQGEKKTFKGENTLLGSLFKLDEARYCGLFPFMLCKPFADRDTSLARLIYAVKHTNEIVASFFAHPEVEGLGLGDINKDTIKGEFLFQGKHVAQKMPFIDSAKNIDSTYLAYRLTTFGEGAFNTTLQNTFTKDTFGYIPNRLTARFYWIANRLFNEDNLDSLTIVMNRMLKFYPLDCGAQYWELVRSGKEEFLQDTFAIRKYINRVKAEEGL